MNHCYITDCMAHLSKLSQDECFVKKEFLEKISLLKEYVELCHLKIKNTNKF